ncbi:MAG: trypsin-like peptidase domain-containing protein [Ignavibacteria bacterium]
MQTQEIIDIYKPAIIQVTSQAGGGSGFYLKEYNLIITNKHVVDENTEVRIAGTLFEQMLKPVLFYDYKYDLAFIEPPEKIEFPLLRIAEKLPSDGERVIAIGHPYGLTYTSTEGIVSKKKRVFDGVSYIQIDAAINPGNSGGPLVNELAEVVGVNTFVISGGSNLGFALSAEHLKESLDEYRAYYGKPAVRCPSCMNITLLKDFNDNYCPNCGTELKLPKIKLESDTMHFGINNTIEKILNELGKNVKLAKRGKRDWEFKENKTVIFISIGETGLIICGAYLGTLPKSNIMDLYTYLLKENDHLQRFSFAVHRENILLSSLISVKFFRSETAKQTIEDLFRYANEYATVLREHYRCIPKEEEE